MKIRVQFSSEFIRSEPTYGMYIEIKKKKKRYRDSPKCVTRSHSN